MKTVLSAAQMRALEDRHMRTRGVGESELMARAARAVVDAIDERLHGCRGRTACFAVGKGNNGGDGRLAAELFQKRGGVARLVSRADELADAAPPDLWVDALLGIGLARPVEGEYAEIIRRMNRDRERGSMLMALDIPSGLSADTGLALGECACVDVTVTFEYAKLGQLLLDGPERCGELDIRSIGMGDEPPTGQEAQLVELPDLQAMLRPRRRNSHKGDYGRLLVVAGSFGMAGAAMLCASAALRSGAGLVTVACPASIVPMIQMKVPSATCLPLPERDGAIAGEAVHILSDFLSNQNMTSVAVGPGLSRRATPELVGVLLTCGLPVVVDADALNLVSGSADLTTLLKPHHLITPHPGEAARLLARAMDSPAQDVLALRALGPTALLKGATTLVAGERLTLCMSGSPGMAKGGSGDVLTGILAALIAQGYDIETAAILGSELHGRAGDAASCKRGVYSMTAEDIIDELGEAFRLVY